LVGRLRLADLRPAGIAGLVRVAPDPGTHDRTRLRPGARLVGGVTPAPRSGALTDGSGEAGHRRPRPRPPRGVPRADGRLDAGPAGPVGWPVAATSRLPADPPGLEPATGRQAQRGQHPQGPRTSVVPAPARHPGRLGAAASPEPADANGTR